MKVTIKKIKKTIVLVIFAIRMYISRIKVTIITIKIELEYIYIHFLNNRHKMTMAVTYIERGDLHKRLFVAVTSWNIFALPHDRKTETHL